ncbi:MAG TPA: protein-L-isoaspartate(D-aspartate) O-methyltransferase [Polyangia bacterium]|nr:protein-L-isoaspartate(D-aspartate) O-methyltransferase [Polyangia bacterium]
MTPDDSARRRRRMVVDQLEARGIRDVRLLSAMRKVPRERFLDEPMRERAYEDAPVPIGGGQTMSQPYMVARMCELCELRGNERVLEVGVGSGYQTAILCELALRVFGVELKPELARVAERRLRTLGYHNLEVGVFDGTCGWREKQPFDAIVVAAGAPDIPALLVDQLADGGRLVVPVGPRQGQRLAIVKRRGGEFTTEWNTPCAFVDLVGRYGWGGDGPARA